jgi:hypothetical protein
LEWQLVESKWQLIALLYTEYQYETTVLLHPNNNTHLAHFTIRQSGLTSNPSQGGFLCSPEHSKVSFEPLEMNSAAQKSLPLQGAGNCSGVALPVSTAGGKKDECVLSNH